MFFSCENHLARSLPHVVSGTPLNTSDVRTHNGTAKKAHLPDGIISLNISTLIHAHARIYADRRSATARCSPSLTGSTPSWTRIASWSWTTAGWRSSTPPLLSSRYDCIYVCCMHHIHAPMCKYVQLSSPRLPRLEGWEDHVLSKADRLSLHSSTRYLVLVGHIE